MESVVGSKYSAVEECPCPDCQLPADGPPAWLRDNAVSIWCGDYFTELADELGEDAAEECTLAFAAGFEKGIVMAMIKPEWVQALYLWLREYYLTTHSLTELSVWEELTDETAAAIPIEAQHEGSAREPLPALHSTI